MTIPTFLENPIFSDNPRKDLEEIYGKLPTIPKKKKERIKISEDELARFKISFYSLIINARSFIYSPIRGAGRPSEITPNKLSKFLYLLSDGLTIEESAPICGFSPAGFYRFQKKNPQFRYEIARVVEKGMSAYLARRSLILLLQKGDPKATMYVLERFDPAYRRGRYVRRPRQIAKYCH